MPPDVGWCLASGGFNDLDVQLPRDDRLKIVKALDDFVGTPSTEQYLAGDPPNCRVPAGRIDVLEVFSITVAPGAQSSRS